MLLVILVRNRSELHILSFELGVAEAMDKKEGDILLSW